MRLNVFEGFRRLLRITQFLWFFGVFGVGLSTLPVRHATYVTFSPLAPLTLTMQRCSFEARSVYVGEVSAHSTRVALSLCFEAQRFSNGRMLIPYKVDSGIWGDERYSRDVEAYVEARRAGFAIPLSDMPQITSMWHDALWKHIYSVTAFLVTGILALELFAWVVGWVARGFLGIPRGQDSRPT